MARVSEGTPDHGAIVLDARLAKFERSGMGRFVSQLCSGILGARETSRQVYLLVNPEQSDAMWLQQHRADPRVTVVYTTLEPLSVRSMLFLHRVVNPLQPSVFLYPHFNVPLFLRMRCFGIVHDLFPVLLDDYIQRWRTLKRWYFASYLRALARFCDGIFCVSETTRRDYLRFTGSRFQSKVHVCYEGATAFPLPHGEMQRADARRFLLYVGDRRPHKNLKRIIDLHRLLVAHGEHDLDLVLAGSPTNYAFDVNAYVADQPCVRLMEDVSDLDLARLYAQADALIFLSQYEGFGLPVVEAGILRKRIIVSDGGSLAEIRPPWAYVVPNDSAVEAHVASVAEYVRHGVVPEAEAASYARRYTWEQTARIVLHHLRAS